MRFSAIKERFVALLRSKRIISTAVLLGALLSLPSLFAGFVADDHLLKQNTVEKTVFVKQSVWNYFTLASTSSETAQLRERGGLSMVDTG